MLLCQSQCNVTVLCCLNEPIRFIIFSSFVVQRMLLLARKVEYIFIFNYIGFFLFSMHTCSFFLFMNTILLKITLSRPGNQTSIPFCLSCVVCLKFLLLVCCKSKPPILARYSNTGLVSQLSQMDTQSRVNPPLCSIGTHE